MILLNDELFVNVQENFPFYNIKKFKWSSFNDHIK